MAYFNEGKPFVNKELRGKGGVNHSRVVGGSWGSGAVLMELTLSMIERIEVEASYLKVGRTFI